MTLTLFEWAAHANFLRVKMPTPFRKAEWEKAWQVLLRVNVGDLFIKRFGERYTHADGLKDFPEPFRLADFMNVYASAEPLDEGSSDIQENYSFLSERSHPSAACLAQHLTWKHGRVVFHPSPDENSPLPLANVAVVDWLVSICELLTLVQDLNVGPQIKTALRAIAEVQLAAPREL